MSSSETSPTSNRTCALFVLDSFAVRLIRLIHASGTAIITVHGPGGATAVYTCATEWECREKQRQIETALTASGYALHPVDERRALAERRRFARGDRRRPSTYR